MSQKALRVNYFILDSWLAYSSTLKMEATCSSEPLVDFHRLHSDISLKIGLLKLDSIYALIAVSDHPF
jgi:hypothetical protein